MSDEVNENYVETINHIENYEYYNLNNFDYLILNKSIILANNNEQNKINKTISLYLLSDENDNFLIILEIGEQIVKVFNVPKDNPFTAFDMFYTIKECYR